MESTKIASTLRGWPSALASALVDPLDRAGAALDRIVSLRPGAVKDGLSGTWLGHPLHPLLTDVTIGAWTSSIALDALLQRQTERAARALVGIGVLSAIPTIASGWSDWSDTTGEDRRLGLLHAAGNAVATASFASSWLARRLGRQGLGRGLAAVGGLISVATGYVGGHLVYGRGLGVDRTAWQEPALERWTPVIDADALPEQRPFCAEAGELRILLVRRGEHVDAIADVCSHRGGPLHDGTLEDGVIACPWHGSRFRVSDGSIVRGPATAPQPAYRARMRSGTVEVKRIERDG